MEVKVEAGNLCVLNALGHGLRGHGAVEGVAVNQPRLLGAAAVRLENVDGLDGVLGLALAVRTKTVSVGGAGEAAALSPLLHNVSVVVLLLCRFSVFLSHALSSLLSAHTFEFVRLTACMAS